MSAAVFDLRIRKRLRGGTGAEQREFELDVELSSQAQRTVLHGPSGAGKSLCLQALAGLLTPDQGHICFAGETLFDSAKGVDQPARRRGFGYLFQDYALFPHLSVRQNIAFGLSRGLFNPGRRVDDAAVMDWLQRFELTPVADLMPRQISGGQRQRTALARALAPEPRALLLDEPFSALDPALRERLRDELAELLARIDIPVLMITHDEQDLQRFGEVRWHLREGRVVAADAR